MDRRQKNMASHLQRLYSEYKKDTDAVASWLAAYGQISNCSRELLPVAETDATTQPVKSGRLKGKARQAAKLSGKSQSTTTATKNILPLTSFVPLAKYIAALKRPPVDVPASVISALRRAILLRISFSESLQNCRSAQGDEILAYTTSQLTRNMIISSKCYRPCCRP